jgi:hypothetical protein
MQEAVDAGCTAVCCDCVGVDLIGDAGGKVWAVGSGPAAAAENGVSAIVQGKVQSIHTNGLRMVVTSDSGSIHVFVLAEDRWQTQSQVSPRACF